MAKTQIKRGDEVVIISGSHKGKRGKVLEMIPKQERVLVEGINLVTHYEKKSQQNPEGGLTKREAPMRTCKVMAADRFEARKAKKQTA
jgi:large subunit ribosomal protein L24